MHPSKIGPFQIRRELGRGGMGVVYLATDSRLDRQVALKGLPAELAADPDRLARFQREAKVLASLNHPNVGGIHGLEEADGHQYLVLEFIEGETLADRLAAGPMSIPDALTVARQIAEGLEAAHEKGIIHRDLKPGNVMVTSEGVVKVLDFGLARTAEGSPSSSSAVVRPDSPTLTSPARHSPTIPGVIMGTAGYMSPEQARGKPVDKRSDIFSFGCVLYEMLTGTMPFRGETVADAIGATLHKELDLAQLPAGVPRRIRELLADCLSKDRRNRLHDIGDARLELERAINGQEWAPGAETAAAPKPSRAATVVAAIALAACSGGVGWLAAGQLGRPAPVAAAHSFHVSTTVESEPRFSSLVGISPDARFVVYTALPELAPESTKLPGVLVVRRLDRDETTVIEGTEGAQSAALSPDGRWVAFLCAKDAARTKLSIKRIALENGRASGKPETVCDVANAAWPNLGWASENEIVFAYNLGSELFAVPASGGEPRIVVPAEPSKGLSGWSNLAPLVPGQSILATRFALAGGKIKADTEAIDLASGKRTVVLADAGAAQLAPDEENGGHLLLAMRADQAGLMAVRFDPTSLRTTGVPVTVWTGNAAGQSVYSENGTLALTTRASELPDRHLARIDDKGQPQIVAGATRAFADVVVSPDGGRVLTNLESTGADDFSNGELWVRDLARRTDTRIPIRGIPTGIIWSRDGQQVVYGAFNTDEIAIWEHRADGAGEATKLFAIPATEITAAMPSAWSPDGKILAIVRQDPKTSSSDVLMLEKESEGGPWKATPYLNSPADEHALRFSPDGKWVLFCSVASGRHQLYAQRFTGVGSGAKDATSGRVQVSTNGHDGSCWWSSDGKEIRYVDGDKQVMSVEVQTEPAFTVSMPKLLYSLKDLKPSSFCWTPEGELMVVLLGQNEQVSRIDLVVNFAEEIRAKMRPSK